MANDRLFLRCRGCGECWMIVKYYPRKSSSYATIEGSDEANDLGTFLERHTDGCVAHEHDFGGEAPFDCVVESGLDADAYARCPGGPVVVPVDT